ncbi:hypothetical protein H4217_004445 [Coemansia sp. RSA 1939]|nr:hypothetical protein H4217_004445 [Coemansia sp. RSA 1939]KAJ2609494.1 hypothetical protein EV177_004438 [Coemansia sp. RSA 1804]
MRVLYVSSGVEPVLNYSRSEMVGRSAHMFLQQEDTNEYQSAFGPLSQENVGMFYMPVKRIDGSLVYLRVIHFDCDGVALNACFLIDPNEQAPPRYFTSITQPFPGGGSGSSGNGEGSLDAAAALEVDRGPPVLNVSADQSSMNIARNIARRNAVAAANAETQRFSATMPAAVAAAIKRNHREVAPTRRACLIVDKVTEPGDQNPMGPRIIFASSSLSRITNVDACDIQGTPLMSLVPPEDVTKTARFLERVSVSDDVVIDFLRLLVLDDEFANDGVNSSNDNDDSADEGYRNPLVAKGFVDVEVMAAGSADGIILLCQQIRSGRILPNGSYDSEGYLSLEEIISSDIETSDYSGNWGQCLS